MDKNQSDKYRIPRVVGEYDSAKRDKGLSGRIGRAAVSTAVSTAVSAANYLNRVVMAGKAYIERTGTDVRKSTLEGSETLATGASNDAGLMKELGFSDNTEKPTDNSGASEGSTDTSKPGANESKTEEKKASVVSEGQVSDSNKDTSVEQASSANKPKAEKGKANTPDKSVDTSGDKPNYYSLDDLIYEDVPKSKANEILRKAYGTAHEPKTLDELIDNPNISKNVVNEILDRVYGSSPEKSDQKDGVNSAKSDQESGAAGSSKDKQAKDLNSEDATYVDDTPTEKISLEAYGVATDLKLARSRFAKASIAVESHFFNKLFGGKKRQEELNAATEELKKCELEYMRLKFTDKIEAAKQDPEKQAELAAEMGQAAFASMQETSRTTTDKYDNMLDDRGKFKKAAAKVGKWFNKGGKIAQWLKLGGPGFAVGATTATFAGWPITTAVGIVTELGVAGATKQAVLEEHRGEDRIAADDRLETIDPSFKDTVANMKIDDVMNHAVNVSVDNLKDVSIERQDALRKKVRSSLGKYGVGFALGGFVGKFVGDWANSAHATGTESHNTTTTPSQSGGEQIPQQPSGTSSMDNSIANINPDTPNFSSYDHPWDWAAEKFGDANAMDQLHNLADKAMANGHTVEWFNNPDGTAWMKIDGSSATVDVLKVLNKYA